MALTDTQKAQIHRLLGYSERFNEQFGTRAQRIEQSLVGLSASIETQVTTLLGTTSDALTVNSILAIEKCIVAQRTRRKASEIGSIVLNPAELSQLRSEGSALLAQMASLLGLEILSNPFYPGAGAAGNAAMAVPRFS